MMAMMMTIMMMTTMMTMIQALCIVRSAYYVNDVVDCGDSDV